MSTKEMKQDLDTVTINGVRYVKEVAQKLQTKTPTGKRYVVVADRGWIFAGDLSEKNGRIYLNNAVNIQNWTSVGFDGMLNDPKSQNVKMKKLNHVVDLPVDCELFRVHVSDNWGL